MNQKSYFLKIVLSPALKCLKIFIFVKPILEFGRWTNFESPAPDLVPPPIFTPYLPHFSKIIIDLLLQNPSHKNNRIFFFYYVVVIITTQWAKIRKEYDNFMKAALFVSKAKMNVFKYFFLMERPWMRQELVE